MKSNTGRRMWESPWRLAESVVVVLGVVVVGFILQLTLGGFDFYLLASPVNLILGGVVVVVCGLMGVARKSGFVRWLSGVSLSVCLIGALLSLTIIMGLTPQMPNGSDYDGIFHRLGFDAMTSSWAFVLVYLLALLSLGTLIMRRACRFKWRDYAFYMNHVGLWLVLFASGLGYADMERYVMHVVEGEVEWRVYDDLGSVKELPVAIQLNDFDMEVYPPKLTVIDRGSGSAQPEDSPDYYQIDRKQTIGNLNGWRIGVEEYIHDAIRNSDSTYREMNMAGAAPAVRIIAENALTGDRKQGWVCGGNQAQLYMTLELTEQQSVVMTVAEPKRFFSDIEVFMEGRESKKKILEVNKPLRVGNWTIYQYGYDNQAGRLSSYSSMELVYDPWLVPVYVGFAMIATGGLVMVWQGRRNLKKGKRDGLE